MIVTDGSPQTLFKSTGKSTVLSCLLISFLLECDVSRLYLPKILKDKENAFSLEISL